MAGMYDISQHGIIQVAGMYGSKFVDEIKIRLFQAIQRHNNMSNRLRRTPAVLMQNTCVYLQCLCNKPVQINVLDEKYCFELALKIINVQVMGLNFWKEFHP